MIFLLFSLFLLGGTPSKLDDFVILFIPLVYLLTKNDWKLSFRSILSCTVLCSLFFFGALRRGDFQINTFFAMISLLYSIIIFSSINVYLRKNELIISTFSIFIIWILLGVYCISSSVLGVGRLSSPGVILFGDISDSHIFSAQFAMLSIILSILLQRWYWVILLCSLIVTVLIGSRSGPFLICIFWLSFIYRDVSHKTFILYTIFIFIISVSVVIGGIIFDLAQFRAFQVGTVSDVHRFSIITNSFADITPIDILIGDEQSYLGARKYYDNFLISVFLLFGITGLIIFLFEIFDNIRLYAPKYIISVLVALLPLSDFLLIPRFQFLFFLLVIIAKQRTRLSAK